MNKTIENIQKKDLCLNKGNTIKNNFTDSNRSKGKKDFNEII